MRPAIPCALAASLLVACSGMTMRVKPVGAVEQRIQHVVLVELDDPACAPEMVQDMRVAFEGIPTLAGWQAGSKVDTGRSQVQAWYTIGIVTEFDSVEDYKAYLEHPRHKALVDKWKPRWKRSEMFDFGGPSSQPEPKP
jgi:hypothetical protein